MGLDSAVLWPSHSIIPTNLWGRSRRYVRGGYARDGQWSGTYVNHQLGVAVPPRRMTKLGVITFDAIGSPTPPDEESVWGASRACSLGHLTPSEFIQFCQVNGAPETARI